MVSAAFLSRDEYDRIADLLRDGDIESAIEAVFFSEAFISCTRDEAVDVINEIEKAENLQT